MEANVVSTLELLEAGSLAPLKSFVLKRKVFTFGTHPMNTFRVKNSSERLHCKVVVVRKSNVAYIYNYSKANPVAVNGVPLQTKATLHSNDTIEVAGCYFKWRLESAEINRDGTALRRVRSTENVVAKPSGRQSVCMLLRAIRQRRTIHSAAFDLDQLVNNGLGSCDEDLTEADITHGEMKSVANTPHQPAPDSMATPVVEHKENLLTPATVDKTPKRKKQTNFMDLLMVSCTPFSSEKERRHANCKKSLSAVKRTPLRSKNCSFATPEHSMYLIDLTTPTAKRPELASTTPKPSPRILTSINLVTPSPTKVSGFLANVRCIF